MKTVKATVAAIIERNGKILLEKRSIEPFKGYWCLPGGHIEFYETVEHAIKREVREETGLKLNPHFLWFEDEIIKKIGWHSVTFVFDGKAYGRLNKSDECSELRWFSVKNALKTKLAFNHNKILKKWVKYKKSKKKK